MTENFSFGKNWKNFLKKANQEKIQMAKNSLKEFLNISDFEGKSFLDIGCGSGLFSFAAFSLGAKKVVSFDIDKDCVECCKQLHAKAGKPKNWKILEGSILEKKFVSRLGKFDIVYAWGTLHHTGKMLEAISNAAMLVKKKGHFYFAIYNKKTGIFGSHYWLKIKKLYNYSPRLFKKILKLSYISYFFISNICHGKNPVANIKKYCGRGMDWHTDVNDWIGGYPYEFATEEEIIGFMEKNWPWFKLENIKTTNGTGNNEYLFRTIK